jgi:hypothetical protein
MLDAMVADPCKSRPMAMVQTRREGGTSSGHRNRGKAAPSHKRHPSTTTNPVTVLDLKTDLDTAAEQRRRRGRGEGSMVPAAGSSGYTPSKPKRQDVAAYPQASPGRVSLRGGKRQAALMSISGGGGDGGAEYIEYEVFGKVQHVFMRKHTSQKVGIPVGRRHCLRLHC